MRTFDSGTTWENKIETDFRWIDDLQFINDSTGYFIAAREEEVGDYKKLLCMTKDTCRSWSIIEEDVSWYYAISKDTIIAMKRDSTFINAIMSGINVMKSIDGDWIYNCL
jgi:hypothetical protein